MELLSTPDAMTTWADSGTGRIGFVPTMGFLHAGHASLMERLRPRCDRLVVSVYVNPLQFGPHEDLDRYPRDPEGDARLCRDAGVDALFMPPELYPDGFATHVAVHGLTDTLCGPRRPGHFEGVATVVARLFGLTRCRLACFGEKDFQQLMVLRRMVLDLAMPVTIVPGALIRDPDGLAMSSRNKYLSADDRRRALTLSRALFAVQAAASDGERDVRQLQIAGLQLLDADAVEYFEVVDAQSLQPLERLGDRPARALVAARVGSTRLIDNVPLGPELRWT